MGQHATDALRCAGEPRAGTKNYAPRQDAYNVPNYDAFGSAHVGGYNAVLCDGAVVTVGYGVDREVHRRFGNRKDGLPASASDL